MAATVDAELAQWERMAAQEHPEVLPLCVETLEIATQQLTERADNIQEIHDEQRSRLQKAGAIILASEAVVLAQSELLERAIGVQVPEKIVLGVGLLAAGAALFKEGLRFAQYRMGLQRTQERADQVGLLYEQAAHRARSMGLLGD